MRNIISLIVALSCSVAAGQTKENTEYNKSITALMGGISQLRTADVNTLKAHGEYLHKLTTIRELQAKIKSVELDNELKYATQFYAKKKLYTDNKPKIQRKISEQYKPERLTSYSIYILSWPVIFDRSEFVVLKTEIQTLFQSRKPENSGLGSKNYYEIATKIEKLVDLLKDKIDQLNAVEYMNAKKFLESLEYEARFQRTERSA